MKSGSGPKAAPQAAAKQAQRTPYTRPPTIREDVYPKPLTLRRSGLSAASWWLRDQEWAEEHLRNLAAAWQRVYGRAA